MARFLCAWSPNWAIQAWRRRRPSERPGETFALVAADRGVRRLSAVDEAARLAGLFPGLTAADACARVPGLVLADAEPDRDREDLERLCDWAARFSPAAAVDPPEGLVLDITGCAHLWKGEEALIEAFVRGLAAEGIVVRTAIASTLGAAWATSRYGRDRACLPAGGEAGALAGLPPAALRLEPALAAQLVRLGLETVGDLAAAPREPLARRFGDALTTRLDQALGRATEALVFRRPAPPWFARLAFAEPISAPDDLARASADIARKLCRRLEAHGQGARSFELAFHGVDGRARPLALRLALADRDPARLSRLFAPKLETVDPGFGLDAVTLAAWEAEPLVPRQARLEPQGRAGEPEDLAPLVDRLAARLGQDALWRAEPFGSHLPERSVRRRPPLERGGEAVSWPGRLRPIRLLRRPEPVEATAPAPDDPPILFRWRGIVRRIRQAQGPERICAEWWRAPFETAQKPPPRDYYLVEDETGARWWLFRAGSYGGDQPPGWWLHGLFA